jgi:hypothetical protein
MNDLIGSPFRDLELQADLDRSILKGVGLNCDNFFCSALPTSGSIEDTRSLIISAWPKLPECLSRAVRRRDFLFSILSVTVLKVGVQ